MEQDKDKKKIHQHIHRVEELMDMKTALSRVADKLRVMICMIRDALSGKYKISPAVFVTIMAGIVYVVNTLDAVPDFIPVVGFVDDATIIAWIAHVIARDMHRYIEWTQGKETK